MWQARDVPDEPALPRTARERARADVRKQILEAGRRELAQHGADGLSLRAVAREVGMVSSAVYRYVASRDDLLTALIIDAYDSLGTEAERAAAGSGGPGPRFVRLCQAMRDWAHAHPHEYALLYGSPVPGYRAPQETIPAAARSVRAASALAQEAYDAGTLAEPGHPDIAIPAALADQALATGESLQVTLPPVAVLRLLEGWAQVFGVISFDLFGQLVGSFEPADALAAYAFGAVAVRIGFTDLETMPTTD